MVVMYDIYYMGESDSDSTHRRVIHIDMDCFYAAIEQREDPSLVGKPIAVGGASRRGVLCTANYEARKYGCRSAMPGFKALELCPELIVLPVRFDLYKSVSAQIRAIFGRFTDFIEPLSLDEAYLDVSHWQSDAASIAREIRTQIIEETRLTASAGIAENKLLSKIASDWNKPNGQHEIKREEVDKFMETLPVAKLWGVGKKMQEKLRSQGVESCGDLQRISQLDLAREFGSWGLRLFELCRGIDHREVTVDRVRKSVSKETTFSVNVNRVQDLLPPLQEMLSQVRELLKKRYLDRTVKSLVLKLKFSDFTQTTVERATGDVSDELSKALLIEGWKRGGERSVRLLGVGVKLAEQAKDQPEQLEMEM